MSPISDKRSDALVDRYVTSDHPLADILRNTAATPSPLARAVRALEDSLEGKRLARDAIRLAQVIQIKDTDPELLLLMLSSWAELSCRIGRPTEAASLIHRAHGMVSEHIHPEVVARVLFVDSLLADTTGDKERQEKLLRSILRLLPPLSSRRKHYVWELALLLAHQGRGVESDKDLSELSWQSNEDFSMTRVLLVKFINAVETGQLQEAALLYPQVDPAAVSARDSVRIPTRGYRALLDLMHGRHNTEEEPDPYVRVCERLLAGDAPKALEIARAEADRLGALFGAGFAAFNLVRAELSAGNAAAAERVLKMRGTRGNRHYLDDLFMARIQWADGNHKAAARHFSTLLKSIRYYRAEGRLDFELKLTSELTQSDVIELTQEAEAIESSAPEEKPESPRPRLKITAEPQGIKMILGRSETASDIRRTVQRFADLPAPVLITGETGTGKDLIARALHETSKQHKEPFTAVNCGSITETLLESELFGHERGAFTGAEKATEGLFAATGKGTILLDEIGDISPRLQAALLRVLETNEVRAVGSTKTRKMRCRMLAATNANLEELANNGHFRRDLLFRLQRLGLHIAPLRERRDDIVLLTRHFLDLGRPIGVHADMTRELRQALRDYDWPGNIRELRNVIERMRLMHSEKLSYSIDDLDLKFRPQGASVTAKPDTTVAPSPLPSPASVLAVPAQPPTTPPMVTPVEHIDAFLKNGSSLLRRMDRLRALFATHRKLTRSEIVQIMAISPNTATKYLKDLCDEKFIRRVTPSASTRSHYFELMN
jgi:DNA-binding NtrC family response regulator